MYSILCSRSSSSSSSFRLPNSFIATLLSHTLVKKFLTLFRNGTLGACNGLEVGSSPIRPISGRLDAGRGIGKREGSVSPKIESLPCADFAIVRATCKTHAEQMILATTLYEIRR